MVYAYLEDVEPFFPPQEEHLHTSMLYSSFIISSGTSIFQCEIYFFLHPRAGFYSYVIFALVSARPAKPWVPDSDKTFWREHALKSTDEFLAPGTGFSFHDLCFYGLLRHMNSCFRYGLDPMITGCYPVGYGFPQDGLRLSYCSGKCFPYHKATGLFLALIEEVLWKQLSGFDIYPTVPMKLKL